MKKNIFVALDFSNFDKAVDVADQVKNDAAGLKITNELFAICGKEGLKKLAGFGIDIFLDFIKSTSAGLIFCARFSIIYGGEIYHIPLSLVTLISSDTTESQSELTLFDSEAFAVIASK